MNVRLNVGGRVIQEEASAKVPECLVWFTTGGRGQNVHIHTQPYVTLLRSVNIAYVYVHCQPHSQVSWSGNEVSVIFTTSHTAGIPINQFLS